MSFLESLLEELSFIEVNASAALIGGTVVLGFLATMCFVPRRRVAEEGRFPPRPNAREMFDLSHAGRGNERRNNLRRFGPPAPIYAADLELSGARLPGWVVDRSSGGLGLVLERPLPVECVINVRSANAPPEAPWVQLRVRHCRPLKGTYQVGCQFQTEQSWRVLLMFG
jgi:hypothetical protein